MRKKNLQHKLFSDYQHKGSHERKLNMQVFWDVTPRLLVNVGKLLLPGNNTIRH